MIIKDNSLTPDALNVTRHRATEMPHTGKYNEWVKSGTYLCRSCGAALFRADSKFNSSCGWPSFDEALVSAVTEKIDTDQLRTEIICARCNAHLGHVFDGEGFTEKNRRFCVNSLSLDFIENKQVIATEEAIIAGGCFWGVEYYFRKLNGVLLTEVGYINGKKTYPSYIEVCAGNTGHIEAVRVIYDPSTLTYEKLIKYFFEIHNPFQFDGQGPDIGTQYQSAIFYYNDHQKQIVEKIMIMLQASSPVATKLFPVTSFWRAESEHQQYYDKTQHRPYCHTYIKRFRN